MTTITDTFNRADDASTLGTTSDGSTTWSTLAGTFGIIDNQAYVPVTTSGVYLAVLDVGATDGAVQVTLAVTGGAAGVVFRAVDADNFYLWYAPGILYDLTGGSFTAVATVSAAASGGDVRKVVLNGTTADFYVNGVLATAGVSIPNRSAATKVGIYNGESAGTHLARYDDFSFTPSAPAVPPRWRPTVRSQATFRAAVI